MPEPIEPVSLNGETPEASESLADEIERRGLGAPAALLLDAHRPLLPLLRQGGIFLSPLLDPLLGRRRFAALRSTLADPAAYDRVARRLASPPAEDRE